MIFPWVSPVFASTTQDVIISQVLPNPTGDDTESEWIEIENTSSSAVSLNGWILSDGFGSTSTFSLDGISIPAFAFLTLYRPDTGIVLNNDAEKVVLKDPSGNMYETALMSKSPEGKAFVFINGSWEWADPVAHADNSPYQSPTPLPISSPLPTASTTPFSPPPTTSPQPTPAFKPPSPLVLNEVVACGPSPEWIEIKNLSDNSLILDGWSLSSSKVSITKLDGIRITPHSLHTIWLSGYYLKNTEDAVKLLEKGSIKDQFAYDICDAKSSWSRDDSGHWYATRAITEGKQNIFEKNQEEKKEKKKTQMKYYPKQSLLRLPKLYIEQLEQSSTTSQSAILGVTTYNTHRTPQVAESIILLGGLLILFSQYKELIPLSKSLVSVMRATIEKI